MEIDDVDDAKPSGIKFAIAVATASRSRTIGITAAFFAVPVDAVRLFVAALRRHETFDASTAIDRTVGFVVAACAAIAIRWRDSTHRTFATRVALGVARRRVDGTLSSLTRLWRATVGRTLGRTHLRRTRDGPICAAGCVAIAPDEAAAAATRRAREECTECEP